MKLCTVVVTSTMFVTKICTTGVLERTRSHEIENDLNYNERSSLIPNYLLYLLDSFHEMKQ